MFMHCVFFWLNDEMTVEERAMFDRALHALLAIDSVIFGHIGVPAGSERAVVDSSYSYSLVLEFIDRDGHEQYQQSAIHAQFVEQWSSRWKRVLIYDSVMPETNQI